jgi:uncharacterized protein (DUF427 family)
MSKAYWNETLIADSDDTVVVDGNHYFPMDALVESHFRKSDHETVCGWKGTANYFDVLVDDDVNGNAAWYYATPKPEAAQLENRVAFWKGVDVRE